MITRDEEYQSSEYSDNEESIQRICQDSLKQPFLEDLANTSILERYTWTQYQLIDQNNMALSDLCHIRNKTHLQQKINQFKSYCQGQPILPAQKKEQTKKKKQISSQFILSFQNIPAYSIAYLSIRQIQNNRFNMITRNAKGQCLAYHWKQRRCKKLAKILKLLAKLRKPLIAVIIDDAHEIVTTLNQLQKIRDVATEFMYIFENIKYSNVSNKVDYMKGENQIFQEKGQLFQFIDNRVLVYSQNMASLPYQDILQHFVNPIKKHEQEESALLQSVRGYYDQNSRVLSLDFLIVNIWRAFNCLPQQVNVIIERLQGQLLNLFNQKEKLRKQYQLQRTQNRDPNSHYPFRMRKSRICKRCYNLYKKKIKRTNFRCEGCSIIFKMDISLCITCFSDFHKKIQFFALRIKSRRINNSKNRFNRQLNRLKDFKTLKKQRKQKSQKRAKMESQLQVKKQDDMHQQYIMSSQFIDRIYKLDKCIDKTFQQVQRLMNSQNFGTIQLFLSYATNMSFQIMNAVDSKCVELKIEYQQRLKNQVMVKSQFEYGIVHGEPYQNNDL